MKSIPTVIVNNHVERVNISNPSEPLISINALDKLAFAMRRSTNKFVTKLHSIPNCFTHTYLESLTYDKATYIVVFGFGDIMNPTYDYVRYEISTDKLLKDIQPEVLIGKGDNNE